MVKETIETPFLYYVIHEHNKIRILEAYWKDGVTVDGPAATGIVEHRFYIQKGIDHGLCLHPAPGLKLNKEARKIFGSYYGSLKLNAIAMVTGGLFESMVVKFLSEIKQKHVPLDVFIDRPDAILFLLKQQPPYNAIHLN